MSESHGRKQGEGHHGNHDENWREHEHHSQHGPYWRRMHRDWKLWIGVAFMLIAITIYILTLNESIRPAPPGTAPGKLQPSVPVSG